MLLNLKFKTKEAWVRRHRVRSSAAQIESARRSADMANLRVVNLAGELILETLLCEENDYGGPDLSAYLGKLVQERTGFPSFRTALVAARKSWHQLGQPSEVQAVFNQAVNDFSADLLTPRCNSGHELFVLNMAPCCKPN